MNVKVEPQSNNEGLQHGSEPGGSPPSSTMPLHASSGKQAEDFFTREASQMGVNASSSGTIPPKPEIRRQKSPLSTKSSWQRINRNDSAEGPQSSTSIKGKSSEQANQSIAIPRPATDLSNKAPDQQSDRQEDDGYTSSTVERDAPIALRRLTRRLEEVMKDFPSQHFGNQVGKVRSLEDLGSVIEQLLHAYATTWTTSGYCDKLTEELRAIKVDAEEETVVWSDSEEELEKGYRQLEERSERKFAARVHDSEQTILALQAKIRNLERSTSSRQHENQQLLLQLSSIMAEKQDMERDLTMSRSKTQDMSLEKANISRKSRSEIDGLERKLAAMKEHCDQQERKTEVEKRKLVAAHTKQVQRLNETISNVQNTQETLVQRLQDKFEWEMSKEKTAAGDELATVRSDLEARLAETQASLNARTNRANLQIEALHRTHEEEIQHWRR